MMNGTYRSGTAEERPRGLHGGVMVSPPKWHPCPSPKGGDPKAASPDPRVSPFADPYFTMSSVS